MKIIPTCLALILFAVTTRGQINDTVVLHTGTGDLEGTLLIPDTDGKVPVALIIAGSGPTDRDGNNPMMKNNSLKMLAEELAGHSVATLRYDKRGIGGSAAAAIPESDLRFEHFVDDAEAWVEYLKKDGRFSRIIAMGHSEGALIAVLVAQDETVSKCVSIAGAGVAANKLLRQQLSAQPAVVMEKAEPIIAALERGDTTSNIPPILLSLFRPDIQPYLISWFEYNPQEEIAKLDKPVLIVQGTTDIQIDVSNANLLFNSNPRAEKRLIEGMNHVLKEAPEGRMLNLATYGEPDRPLADGLVARLADFIYKKH